MLRFPEGAWAMELVGIAFLFFSQLMRIDLGKRSNASKQKVGIAMFLGLSVLMLGFYIYFGFYTTFVIVLDIIFGVMGLFFVLLELILSVVALVTFGQDKV